MVWANGAISTGVIGHKFGHNLRLGHSGELDCIQGGTRLMDRLLNSHDARLGITRGHRAPRVRSRFAGLNVR